MKKSLLALTAVLGMSAGAYAQGYVNLIAPSTAGFNSVSSNPNDSGAAGTYSDFPSGSITLEIFTLPSAGNLALVQTLNAQAASASTEQAAVQLLGTDGFTQQAFTPQANGVGAEQMSQALSLSTGAFASTSEGVNLIGTANFGTTDYYIALLATMGSGANAREGVLVLYAVGAGYTMGTSTSPNTMSTDWGNNQNLLLAPVPEPTTLALAGLGGLSLLALRRRKA